VSIWPGPNEKRPIEGNANVQFIKATVTRPNIVAGDYSYDDARAGEAFEERVLYQYEILGERLIIGKFCQIAPGVTYVMNGANYRMDGNS